MVLSYIPTQFIDNIDGVCSSLQYIFVYFGIPKGLYTQTIRVRVWYPVNVITELHINSVLLKDSDGIDFNSQSLQIAYWPRIIITISKHIYFQSHKEMSNTGTDTICKKVEYLVITLWDLIRPLIMTNV